MKDFIISHPMGELRIYHEPTKAFLSTQTGKISLCDGNFYITNRSLSEYRSWERFPKDFIFDCNKQYVESGGGLSQLMSILTNNFNLKNRPIAIDPFNISLIIELLELGLENGLSFKKTYRNEIRVYLERANLLLDDTKVKFYNTTLSEAVDNNPELVHCADFLIDVAGASMYSMETYNNYRYKILK